jgi:SAM-dependent methyltransferase
MAQSSEFQTETTEAATDQHASATGFQVVDPKTRGWRSIFRFNRFNRDCWVRKQAAALPSGTLMLDVGAGCGPYRHLFTHCQYRSHDFGKTPETIGNYTPLDYESDICDIPEQDDTFDCIVCTEVLEHVPEPIEAVREISRLLKPGGKLIVSAPQGSELHQEPYHFYGGYTPHWYQHFLNKFDIEIVSIERNRGFFGLFAQEGERFSAYLRPRFAKSRTPWWPLLAVLWLMSIPVFKVVLPLLAKPLDSLRMEQTSTVGYHIVAKKRDTRQQQVAA